MSNAPYAAFGDLLRQARKLTEYADTQPGLSRKLGFSRDYYGKIESGSRLVSVLKLAKMMQVLPFDANQLVDAIPVDVANEKSGKKEVGGGPYIAFGQLLASARLRLQFTQSELARVIGYSCAMLSRVENGHLLPPLLRFAQLRRVLGFDCKELLRVVLEPGLYAPFIGFGRLVEQARLARSMASQEVAEEIGCSPAYYQHIERGSALPSLPVAIRIHQVIGFDVDAAFRWVWQNRGGELT